MTVPSPNPVPNARILSLGMFAAGTVLVALLAGAAGVFAVASLAMPGLLLATDRRTRWARWAWAGLGVWLVVAGLGVLGLRGRLEPRILGLPPAAVVMVLGLWLVPLVASTWIYAASRAAPVPDENEGGE